MSNSIEAVSDIERAQAALLEQLKAEGWDTSNFGSQLWERVACRAMIRLSAQKHPEIANVPDSVYVQNREAFEAAFPHLELDLKAKQWGPLPYMHDHVNSLFHGFVIGRAHRTYPDNPNAMDAVLDDHTAQHQAFEDTFNLCDHTKYNDGEIVGGRVRYAEPSIDKMFSAWIASAKHSTLQSRLAISEPAASLPTTDPHSA